MFMRIFFARRCKLAATAAIALTVACVLSTIIVNLLICRPISLNWRVPLGPGNGCGNSGVAFLAIGIIDIVNQLAILMLPFPTIIRLGMETRYKVMTAFIFGIGIL